MAAKHHIYLVPGFFGFANLGELLYFGHVRDYLKAELARRGAWRSRWCQSSRTPRPPSAARRGSAQGRAASRSADDDGPIHLWATPRAGWTRGCS